MRYSFRIPIFLITLFLFSTLLLIQQKNNDDSLAPPFVSTDSPPSPKLHFLLPATHSTPEFCKTLLTTLLYDYEPILINWGVKASGGQARQIKIKGVHEYISNNVTDPTDLIFMIDAFDVWLQQPPSVLITKYLSSFPPRVVLGADKRAWPPSPNPFEFIDIPESTLPSKIFGKDTDTGAELADDHTFYLNRPRFPNSGTILSPQSLLLPLYTSLLQQSTTRDANLGDQQLFLSTYYSDNNPPQPSSSSSSSSSSSDPLLTSTSVRRGESSLLPDFESKLFQTMTYSQTDMSFTRHPTHLRPSQLDSKTGIQRLVFNHISGTLPSVLHFNGNEKSLLGPWWEKMWWVTGGEGERSERDEVREWVKRKVRGGGVRVGAGAEGGRWIGWDEMRCEGEGGEVWGSGE